MGCLLTPTTLLNIIRTLDALVYNLYHNWWFLFLQFEVATGKFPYPKWNSVFDQLTQVVQGDPPKIPENDHRFSDEFINFVNTW